MVRTPLKIFIAVGLLLSVVKPVLGQAPVLRSAHHDYRVVKVADGLITPWSMAFLPGGEVPPVAVPLPMLDPEPSVVPGVGAS